MTPSRRATLLQSESTSNSSKADKQRRTLEFDNNAVKMQIWDTAGQERFRTITSAYYKNAQGIIMVFDLRVRKTLENIE